MPSTSPPAASAKTDHGYVVRPGHDADLPAVYALVCELAEFERARHEVATDVAAYRRDLAAGCFELLVAEHPAAGVGGMMLYYPAYSTWKGRMLYLEDFVVAQRARRRGVGSALWEALVRVARERECTSVKWQVLDWNEPARAFYRARGAELESGWENGRLWL